MNRSNSNGSMSLTAIASVGGGIAFALTLANLARYVTVENALEQTLQATARCIDPTDGACNILDASGADSEFDWYLASRGEQQTFWADRYNYSARVFRENWQLRFPAFEVRKIPLPPIELRQSELPVSRFLASLNAFERRGLRVEAEFPALDDHFFTPAATPNFPEFDPGYEDDRKDQEPALWSPRALNIRGDVRRPRSQPGYVSRDLALPAQTPWQVGGLRLSDEPAERRAGVPEVREVASDWYEVPILETDPGEQAVCLENGVPCSTLTDITGGGLDWRDYAYVAVKAFAVARRIGGSPEIKWAGSAPNRFAPDGFGLALETLPPEVWQPAKARARESGANVNEIVRTAPVASQECLGGRDWSHVRDDAAWKNFHLVLRGAIKRHPSDNSIDGDGIGESKDPMCPNGDRKHWNLAVPRGGAYRIRGWIKVRGGTVETSVMFKHYIDTYHRVEVDTPPLKCDRTIAGREAGENTATCVDACADLVSAAYRSSPSSCKVSEVREPICESEAAVGIDPTIVPVARPSECNDGSFAAARCDDVLPYPDTALCRDELQSFAGSKVCITKIADLSTALYPEQKNCPLAKNTSHTVICDDTRTEIIAGEQPKPVEDCPAVQRESARLSGLPPVTSGGKSHGNFSPAAHWKEVEEPQPERWERTLIRPEVANPDSIRSVEAILSTAAPRYATVSTAERPPLSAFPLSASELERLSVAGTFSLVQNGTTPVAIRSVYPFVNEPEIEIPDFLPNEASLLSCSGTPVALDERLRAYAAVEIPEAADPKTLFESSAEYVDSMRAGLQSSCATDAASVGLPKCSKVTHVEKRTVECAAPRYLGRFSTSQAPEVPPECASPNA